MANLRLPKGVERNETGDYVVRGIQTRIQVAHLFRNATAAAVAFDVYHILAVQAHIIPNPQKRGYNLLADSTALLNHLLTINTVTDRDQVPVVVKHVGRMLDTFMVSDSPVFPAMEEILDSRVRYCFHLQGDRDDATVQPLPIDEVPGLRAIITADQNGVLTNPVQTRRRSGRQPKRVNPSEEGVNHPEEEAPDAGTNTDAAGAAAAAAEVDHAQLPLIQVEGDVATTVLPLIQVEGDVATTVTEMASSQLVPPQMKVPYGHLPQIESDVAAAAAVVEAASHHLVLPPPEGNTQSVAEHGLRSAREISIVRNQDLDLGRPLTNPGRGRGRGRPPNNPIVNRGRPPINPIMNRRRGRPPNNPNVNRGRGPKHAISDVNLGEAGDLERPPLSESSPDANRGPDRTPPNQDVNQGRGRGRGRGRPPNNPDVNRGRGRGPKPVNSDVNLGEAGDLERPPLLESSPDANRGPDRTPHNQDVNRGRGRGRGRGRKTTNLDVNVGEAGDLERPPLSESSPDGNRGRDRTLPNQDVNRGRGRGRRRGRKTTKLGVNAGEAGDLESRPLSESSPDENRGRDRTSSNQDVNRGRRRSQRRGRKTTNLEVVGAEEEESNTESENVEGGKDKSESQRGRKRKRDVKGKENATTKDEKGKKIATTRDEVGEGIPSLSERRNYSGPYLILEVETQCDQHGVGISTHYHFAYDCVCEAVAEVISCYPFWNDLPLHRSYSEHIELPPSFQAWMNTRPPGFDPRA